MKRLTSKVIIAVMVLLMLTGCVPKNKNVVVTSYPVQYLMERLAGNRVNIQRLDSGSIPQRAQISTDYKKIIAEGNTIFYINELQPYWQIYLDEIQNSDMQMIDLAERSVLYPFMRYTYVSVDGKTHAIETEYYDSTSFETVDKYDRDPFLWMDPLAMTSMARTIKDWLVETYPDEAAIFNKRFDELEVELTMLQAEYQVLAENPNLIKMVTMTPSFGNWQKSFGIGVYPVSLSKYGVLPDNEMLNDVRARIQQDDVKYIVYEEGLSEEYIKLFNQLKTEFDLIPINLSNVYNLTEADIESNYDYIAKMKLNLEVLETLGK